MKLGILVVILCLLTPLAQARPVNACEERFSREKVVRDHAPLTTDLEPITLKVTAPNSRLHASQPEKFDDLNPRATTQLLLLLGKYSEPRERALAIEVLGGRTYRPESLAALGVALTKVSKVEAEKIYEVFLFKNHSSEATSAIIDLAFVYKHGRNPSAPISREKILLRNLGEEHVELLSRTFDAFTTVLWTEYYREARIILIQALAKTKSPAARQVLVEIARGEWGEAQVAANLPYDSAAAKAERRIALDETMAAAAAVLEHMPAVADARDKPK